MNRTEMEQILRAAGATVYTVNGEDSDEWVLRAAGTETPLRADNYLDALAEAVEIVKK